MTADELYGFCHNHRNIYCYGAGRYGRTLLVHLREKGLDLSAFLVTGQPAEKEILGKPVISVKDISFVEGDGVLLAVSSRFMESMKQELMRQGVREYVWVNENLLEEIEADTEFMECSSSRPYVNVLMYHRVAKEPCDTYGIVVSPEHFAEQMAYIAETFHAVRTEDDWSHIEKPSVAVTFDDGYADNFHNALPILEEYGIPVTFFVSTEHLGTDELFWWDILEGMFRVCRQGEVGLGNRKFDSENLQEAHSFLRCLLPEERSELLSDAMKHQDLPGDIWGRRALSIEELQQMSKSPLVTIGLHTVTHSSLSNEPESLQNHEIASSKARLEEIIGKKATVLSYPFGDYNEATLAILKECDIKKAFTVTGGVDFGKGKFEIPRNKVTDIDGKGMEKMLRRCHCLYA